MAWYSASIADGLATIEIVYEENDSSSTTSFPKSPSLSFPESPSFEQAMDVVSLWLKSWEEGQLSDEAIAHQVGEMIATKNGPRGFFVVSLTSECPLMDRLPSSLVSELRDAGDSVVSLMGMNLAMSTAMQDHHTRNGDELASAGSKRVQSRSIQLLQRLEPTLVNQHLTELQSDTAFMDRWGYDTEQRKLIVNVIETVLATVPA
jgi:hypothetical protein